MILGWMQDSFAWSSGICEIDDFLVVGRSERECLRNRAFLRNTLRRAGFVESLSKAMEPTQVGQFLGLEIDMKRRLVFIPDDKLTRIVKRLKGSSSARESS